MTKRQRRARALERRQRDVKMYTRELKAGFRSVELLNKIERKLKVAEADVRNLMRHLAMIAPRSS